MYEPDLVYLIRGVAFDIYNNVAGSWSEESFEEIMFDVLTEKGLRVVRQKEYEVIYKGNKVGLYRPDLIIEDKIILELKVAPEIYTLHQAQIISYLKITGLKLGMLINFGGEKIYNKAFPNNVSQKRVLNSNFNINKVNLSKEDKSLILPYLMISKEILEILGPGYFHQIYRRAFWDELKRNNIGFEWKKKIELNYKGKVYGSKEVRFFKINDLLVSIVAIKSLDNLAVNRFSGYIKYYQCNKGLIVNFNNTILDFRYLR